MKSQLQQKALRKNFLLSRQGAALSCFFIMVFVMGLVKIYSPDLGFHLRSAQWIIDNRQFIHNDSFNYGAGGSKYYDMQWLFQLFVYGLYKAGGDSALVIGNALLITIALGLVWVRFVKNELTKHSAISTGLFAFMAILLVQPLTFEIRPHVFSWIFLNLTLIFLDAYKKGNKKALFALPLILLFWANTHSLAILGLVTIGIYIAGIYFETKKVDKQLLLFFGLSFIAFLLTPYFISGLYYTFTQFGLVSGNSLLKSYFGELQSPFSSKEIDLLGAKYFSSPLLIIHLSALLSLFSLFRSLSQKQFTDSLLLAAYLVLLYMANKNYGYFLMVSLPLFVKYVLGWLERKKRNKSAPKASNDKKKNKAKAEPRPVIVALPPSKLSKRLALAAIILALFISITSITNSYPIFRHSPYRFGFTMDKDQLPVEAIAFLNKNQVRGRILNHLDFGGYLMANYEEKVFIDGRMDVLPETFFKKYYESLTVRNGVKKLLDEYNPDIVIFPYVKAYGWWEYFVARGARTGYRPVYFDGLSVIYLKAGTYPQLPAISRETIWKTLDPAAITRVQQCIETSKPAGLAVLLKGLWQPQRFSISDQNRAIYCFTNGYDTAGLNYSVRAIENSTVNTPNIFKNLSIYYRDKKMYGEAAICEEKAE